MWKSPADRPGFFLADWTSPAPALASLNVAALREADIQGVATTALRRLRRVDADEISDVDAAPHHLKIRRGLAVSR
jgi:hypothetical protein